MPIKPERQAKRLSIDEFKLHNSHRYATHMIKNFNDNMVSEVRKDEQRRLQEEDRYKGVESDVLT